EASLSRGRADPPAAGECAHESNLRPRPRCECAGSGSRPDAPVLTNREERSVMDLVLKLREIRRLKILSQKDVARLSGVGEKTISSFETGQRIGSLKLAQLRRLLGVYGLTEADF